MRTAEIGERERWRAPESGSEQAKGRVNVLTAN